MENNILEENGEYPFTTVYLLLLFFFVFLGFIFNWFFDSLLVTTSFHPKEQTVSITCTKISWSVISFHNSKMRYSLPLTFSTYARNMLPRSSRRENKRQRSCFEETLGFDISLKWTVSFLSAFLLLSLRFSFSFPFLTSYKASLSNIAPVLEPILEGLVSTIISNNKKLRILEIGAGTGGATTRITMRERGIRNREKK